MPPITLFRYISLRTVTAVAALFVILMTLIMLIDLIENLRFADKFQGADFGFALTTTLLRAPSLSQAMLPFVFLFASIWLFTQLNRRAEIAVMRSAGLSVWRLIGPAAFVAAMTGFIIITIADPAATHMRAQSERMKDALRGKTSSIVRVFGDGIWLRQHDADNLLLINAHSFNSERAALTQVVMWRLNRDSNFIERIDAPEAILSGNTIELYKARVKGADEQLDHRTPIYAIPTSLTPADLDERIEPPETLSIWRLPKFIILAKAAGLPTAAYNIRFHDLCSTPLKLLAMVLIAAMFSLRPVRSGGGLKLFLFAIGAGFLLYILSEISTALGESALAPVSLAAWTPAIVATLVAISGLLYMEDG